MGEKPRNGTARRGGKGDMFFSLWGAPQGDSEKLQGERKERWGYRSSRNALENQFTLPTEAITGGTFLFTLGFCKRKREWVLFRREGKGKASHSGGAREEQPFSVVAVRFET